MSFEFVSKKASGFLSIRGRATSKLKKGRSPLLLFLPGPPVSWRSNRLPARPGTWPREEEDEPAMVRERRAREMSLTPTTSSTSIETQRRQRRESMSSTSARAAAAAAAAPYRARGAERQGAMRSLSLSLTRARCACVLACPARLSGERRSERKRKKNRVDFCRSRCFAFPRLSFTSPSRPSLLPLLIVFLHFHCSLLLFFFREPGPRERARDLSLSLSL